MLADSSIEHLFELSRLRHTTSVHYWPCVSYGRREAFTNRSHSRLLPRTLSPPSAPASQVRSHPCCPARAATSQPAPPTPWRYRLACSALRSHSLQSALSTEGEAHAGRRHTRSTAWAKAPCSPRGGCVGATLSVRGPRATQTCEKSSVDVFPPPSPYAPYTPGISRLTGHLHAA